MGRTYSTFVIALAIAASVIGIDSKAPGHLVHADPDRAIVVQAEEAIDAQVIWQAISTYRSGGLDLPDMEIQIHDNAEACGGARGRYATREGRDLLLICARHANPRVEIRWRLDTMLHELAHAHMSVTFLESDVNSFIDANELSTWLNRKAHWHERGAEVAAESLVWGLTGHEPDVRIEASCDQLLDNYLLITDTQPVAKAFENCR